jgi:hypothetical protein
VTCVYCHEDFAGTPTACPTCGLPTSDPGTPGRHSRSVLDRTLSWSRTSVAGFFQRLRNSPGGIWTIPLAIGLVAGLFLGLGYALGTHTGETTVARDADPAATTTSTSASSPSVQTASSALPVTPEAVTPVITQAFPPPADQDSLTTKPAEVKKPAATAVAIDYFAEPKIDKAKLKKPRLQYPNWALYEMKREAMPPPHILAMNPYRERSPIYVYMMGIEHPYLSDVSLSYEGNGGVGPGPRLDFTGE